MPTESIHQIAGLSFQIGDPLWYVAPTPLSLFTNEVEQWEHEIATDGGYRYGKMQMRTSRSIIEDWIENGLGRNLQVFSAGGTLVWEGFANNIKGTVGTLSITRGPLMHVANRVLVAYRPYIDICVDPPEQGTPTVTTLVEDTNSQTWYGIQEDIVSGGVLIDDATYVTCDGGEVVENEAEMMRDAYLAEMKYPQSSQEVTLGDVDEPTLEIEFLGYYEWLDRYPYIQAFAHYVTIPAKIEAVLTADPNSIISSDYSRINKTSSFLQLTHDGDEQYRTAMTIIEELVSRGDANANRTYFAVYDDRKAYYDVIPTDVEYYHRISSRDQTVQTPSGQIIPAWQVRPAKWVFFSDFLAGRVSSSSDIRFDPRYMFIESVRYTAPNGLRLVGGKVSTIKQLMARKGLGL